MLAKLLSWLPTNIAGILGIVQAVIKFIKELLTLAVNILLPVIPGDKFDGIVIKVRDAMNKIDEGVEKIKSFLLKVGISA
ncbi:MAG: hypothetical protein NTZ48_07100 [Candidatus Omnitrophica bacterium]|nr:hypothetical protein [Candidatus Omnitrophota bacterium]